MSDHLHSECHGKSTEYGHGRATHNSHFGSKALTKKKDVKQRLDYYTNKNDNIHKRAPQMYQCIYNFT